MSIHNNYLNLTTREEEFVNEVMRKIFRMQKEWNSDDTNTMRPLKIRLDTGDEAERVVEAIAVWIIQSREEN